MVLTKCLPLSGVQIPTCQMQALASVSSSNAPYCGLTPLAWSLAETWEIVYRTLILNTLPPYSSLFGSFAGDLSTATKSKTSEDISQASKYSPAYSPDPYYASESEYWTYHGSPKGSVPCRGAKARALSPRPGIQGPRIITCSFNDNSLIHSTNMY